MVEHFSGSIDFSKFSHYEQLAINTDSRPVVMLTQGKSDTQGNITTQKKLPSPQSSRKEKFYFISAEEKQIATQPRAGVHLDAEKIVMGEVVRRWEIGNPATSPEIYHLLRTKFGPDTLFHHTYLEEKKHSTLSQWFSRLLDRKHWTIRKTTVSQKVPANWIEVAQVYSAQICETMRAAGVDVLINGDQTFVLFTTAWCKTQLTTRKHNC